MPPSPATEDFGHVVAGGGTAGSVSASRLTGNPAVQVAVVQGRPSGIDRPEAPTPHRRPGSPGGDLGHDHPATAQSRGNPRIRHSEPPPVLPCSPDGGDRDARILVDGIRTARGTAKTEPLAGRPERKGCPAPRIVSGEENGEYAGTAAHTLYAPDDIRRMGAVDDEPAVGGTTLRTRGPRGARVADASVLPATTAVDLMAGVLTVGEKCAELPVQKPTPGGDA